MIELVEALNYRCLHYVRQRLSPFQVLIGPNASGKTTFLDTVAFLGDLVRDGLSASISERTRTFEDLIWQRQGSSFELALEARIPEDRKQKLQQKSDSVRYEVKIGTNSRTGEVSILAEKVLLKRDEDEDASPERELFPIEPAPPSTIVSSKGL
ncbi:MAG: AAA family ATPase, partial [FCB group bacterium]|nr:AAA family ATPase [FCB group bacterium]